MKKAILFVMALILLSVATNAQEGGARAFDENSRILNVGIGVGNSYYRGWNRGNGYYYRSSPAFSLSYEQPYKKRLGPGFLGIGGYLGFQTASHGYEDYRWGTGTYYSRHSYRNFLVAGRAAYHWDVLNVENAEVYGGVILGFRMQTYSYSTDNPDRNFDYSRNNSFTMYPTYSLFAGARWYFVPRVGVFGEVGYGISYLTLGLSFKL